MSTSEDIAYVYLSDIADKANLLRRTHGISVFYDSYKDIRAQNIYPYQDELNELWLADERARLEALDTPASSEA